MHWDPILNTFKHLAEDIPLSGPRKSSFQFPPNSLLEDISLCNFIANRCQLPSAVTHPSVVTYRPLSLTRPLSLFPPHHALKPTAF